MLTTMNYPLYAVSHIEVPFPVILRGIDTTGDRFELHGVLDCFSSRDLSLRIARALTLGSQLFACVSLSLAADYQHTATRVVMLGTVRQSAPIGGPCWRVVITFDRHRFLHTCAE